MKVTTTFAAVVGALAVLAPLTSAAAVAPRDSIAVQGDNLEARSQTPSQAARQRLEEAKRKAAEAKARAEAAARRKKNRKSSKLPTSTTPLARAVTTSTKAATSTRAATTSRAATSSVRATTTTSSKPATTTSTNTTFTNFQNDILNIHNVDRAKHSASPLVWDSTVAAAAAKWAAGCKWAHTPNNPYGQNIAAGTWDTFGAKDTTDLWYDEYKLYDYNKAQYSEATGHFTQMVWKGSKKLGCAIQRCSAQQMGLGGYGSDTANYVVCNYDPPGNWIGEFAQNVTPN